MLQTPNASFAAAYHCVLPPSASSIRVDDPTTRAAAVHLYTQICVGLGVVTGGVAPKSCTSVCLSQFGTSRRTLRYALQFLTAGGVHLLREVAEPFLTPCWSCLPPTFQILAEAKLIEDRRKPELTGPARRVGAPGVGGFSGGRGISPAPPRSPTAGEQALHLQKTNRLQRVSVSSQFVSHDSVPLPSGGELRPQSTGGLCSENASMQHS